jgi:hypothetical protein
VPGCPVKITHFFFRGVLKPLNRSQPNRHGGRRSSHYRNGFCWVPDLLAPARLPHPARAGPGQVLQDYLSQDVYPSPRSGRLGLASKGKQLWSHRTVNSQWNPGPLSPFRGPNVFWPSARTRRGQGRATRRSDSRVSLFGAASQRLALRRRTGNSPRRP